MDKPRAIVLLRRQIAAMARIDMMFPFAHPFHEWQRDTTVVIREVFGHSSQQLTEFGTIHYDIRVGSISEANRRDAFAGGLSRARAMLESMVREVTDFWDESQVPGGASLDPVARVLHLCRRFPVFARQLQRRWGKRLPFPIEDEHDLQDIFHACLLIDFEDVRPEEWSPSYAGGSSRLDFLLKPEQVVIELKKSRHGLSSREVGEQLLVDIARYQAHTDCRALVCFAFDPDGLLSNPRGLEADLSRTHGTLPVSVVIAP